MPNVKFCKDCKHLGTEDDSARLCMAFEVCLFGPMDLVTGKRKAVHARDFRQDVTQWANTMGPIEMPCGREARFFEPKPEVTMAVLDDDGYHASLEEWRRKSG